MSGSFDAVVIGAIGIDTNVYLYADEVDFNVEANFSKNIDYLGQAGGYSCRLFRSLGWNTAFIGYVGKDFQGEYIRGELKKDGIDSSALFTDPSGTKRSINFMYRDGRRKNFYDGKASMEAKPDLERCRRVLRGAKLAHFSIVNWARYLLDIAREESVLISCDIQDIVDVEDEYRKDFIEKADILFFSAANHPDPRPLMERFLRIKPGRTVICGRGKEGCAIGNDEGITFYPPVEIAEPVVDSNGAGDSLAVGYLSAKVLEARTEAEAILRGQALARHTCTIKASSSDFLSHSELENLAESLS